MKRIVALGLAFMFVGAGVTLVEPSASLVFYAIGMLLCIGGIID